MCVFWLCLGCPVVVHLAPFWDPIREALQGKTVRHFQAKMGQNGLVTVLGAFCIKPCG